MTTIVWKGVETASSESCRIEEGPRGVLVESRIHGGAAACSYTLRATEDWEFTGIVVRAGGRELDVHRTDRGWEVSEEARSDLRDAREVDISASPFSNTLPIRRLRLDIGESADIITAYIRMPELEVTPDPQRYTRISENEYLYESRDSDFRRSLTVDVNGLVVEYPGLFTRAVDEPPLAPQ